MRTQPLCSLLLPLALTACASSRFGDAPLREGELLSREKYEDYQTATYSFEHGVRDDPDLSITNNDWDLQFGNGGDEFSVTMVTDDRSRLVDLGRYTWDELEHVVIPVPEPHAEPTREPDLPVIPGHVYVVHTADRETDLVALVRVESLVPGDRVRFTWRLLDPRAVSRD